MTKLSHHSSSKKFDRLEIKTLIFFDCEKFSFPLQSLCSATCSIDVSISQDPPCRRHQYSKFLYHRSNAFSNRRKFRNSKEVLKSLVKNFSKVYSFTAEMKFDFLFLPFIKIFQQFDWKSF